MGKKSSAAVEQENSNRMLTPVLKGAFFAVFASLILVLLFAFIIKFSNMSDSLISPINQVIKIISILAGVIFAVSKSRGQGLIKGLIIGLLYVVFSFIVFSILDGSFKLTASIINDLLFGSVAGAASGIIANLVIR